MYQTNVGFYGSRHYITRFVFPIAETKRHSCPNMHIKQHKTNIQVYLLQFCGKIS